MGAIINLYLEYLNDFLTVEKFAEYHQLEPEDAQTIISLGRKYFTK